MNKTVKYTLVVLAIVILAFLAWKFYGYKMTAKQADNTSDENDNATAEPSKEGSESAQLPTVDTEIVANQPHIAPKKRAQAAKVETEPAAETKVYKIKINKQPTNESNETDSEEVRPVTIKFKGGK